MNYFISYWKSYPNEYEANDHTKNVWSSDAIDADIIYNAFNGIYSLLTNKLIDYNNIYHISDNFTLTNEAIIYNGIRVSLFAISKVYNTDLTPLVNELTDRSRESLCLCIAPSSQANLSDYFNHITNNHKANIIFLYPCDIDALASNTISLLDIIEYKIFQLIYLDKNDHDSQYDKLSFDFYSNAKANQITNFEDEIDFTISEQHPYFKSMIDHPLVNNVHRQISNLRNCYIIGPSSSGKTILALQVGQAFLLSGNQVRYLNLSNLVGYPSNIFEYFLLQQSSSNLNLLIVDDLQSNPNAARLVFTISSMANRISSNTPPLVIGISWPEYSSEIIDWFENCYPVQVRPEYIANKIADMYATDLSQDDITEILNKFKDDILLLRLSLESSKRKGKIITLKELVKTIWENRIQSIDLPEETLIRIVLVVGSLGRYDIIPLKEFVKFESQVTDKELSVVIERQFVRSFGDSIAFGHRSLCGLIVDWLTSRNCWNNLAIKDGPANNISVMLDYLKAQGSSLAVDTIRALQARSGFKEKTKLSVSAATLVELWDSFNSVVQMMEKQQVIDPTWWYTPSSAMFAIRAFCEIGKVTLASQSISFLKKHWDIINGELQITTQGLSTNEDFLEIKKRMEIEDDSFTDQNFPIGWDKANQIDHDQFHQTWLIGIILCAEAYSPDNSSYIHELVKLVEKLQLENGAFYPSRVPWCTARVLLGLATCGRTMDNSECVRKAVDWLTNDCISGGSAIGGIWHSGTGSWNTTLETTGIVLLALAATGYDISNDILEPSRAYLVSQRSQWTAQGKELDGVQALQAYLETGGEWEDIANETQYFSKWARSASFWQSVRESAGESLEQSCRVAQISSHLIDIGWRAIRANLPNFLEALSLPETFSSDLLKESSESSRVSTKLEQEESKPKQSKINIDELVIQLENISEISIPSFTVVGQYCRYDERIRNILKDWKNKIINPLNKSTLTRENFLIWAGPGSGKTFFVEEIAKSISYDINFVVINLAREQKEEIKIKLELVSKSEKPVLCLIDEIDARNEESWPYDLLFTYLDLNLEPDNKVVFVIVGSSQLGVESLARYIRTRIKGVDLMDRVPDDNFISIPQASGLDKIVFFVKHLVRATVETNKDINEIEKLALYYIIKSDKYNTPRQIRELAYQSVYRVPQDDNRFKYDHLFNSGDRNNQQFYVDKQEAANRLSNLFIQIIT
jgi:hypothetical protein